VAEALAAVLTTEFLPFPHNQRCSNLQKLLWHMQDLALRMADLDRQVRPIANRPVDITKPGWAARLIQGPHPLDEAAVRSQMESLFADLTNLYCTADGKEREEIRELFQKHKAFAWAATLPCEATTEDNFHRHLVLFSMNDQGTDSRDALLLLQHLCRTASAAGINTAPLLSKVAELSSDRNKYGMGSTRDILLKFICMS